MDGTGLTPALLAVLVAFPSLVAGAVAGHGLSGRWRQPVLILGSTLLCGPALGLTGVALAPESDRTAGFAAAAVGLCTALALPGCALGSLAGAWLRRRFPPRTRRRRGANGSGGAV
jgi:hypothetical protein